MRQSIVLIVGAMVMLIAGLTVMFLTTNTLGNTNHQASSIPNESACRYQWEEAERNGNYESIDDRCRNGNNIPEDYVVANNVLEDIT